MGDVFSLFAFILSLVAVVLAATALRRVNTKIAQDVHLRAAQARHLNDAVRSSQQHRDRVSRRQTFSEDDLAPSAPSPKDAGSNGGTGYSGGGYPSAKSIELAKELDRKRQEARKVAAEQGLAVEEDDTGPRFVPTSNNRRQA